MSKLDRLTDDDIVNQLQARIAEAVEEANRNTVQEEARLLCIIEAQAIEIDTLKLQLGRLQEIANIYKKITQEHWADFQAQFKQA